MTENWITFVITFVALQHAVQSEVTLEVDMQWFVSNGDNWDGDPCDYSFFGRGHQCDTKFIFCFDSGNGTDDMNDCFYGSYNTGHYQEQYNITFSADMRGLANPINMSLSSWPGSVKFKTEVRDDDYGNDDLIDRLYTTISSVPAKTSSRAGWRPHLVFGTRNSTAKTELHFIFRVYCMIYYFGSACDVYCKAKDDSTGHYTCDSNGQKICRSGWETVSSDCTIKKDNCESHKCQNGARCVDGYNSYTCHCVPGYSGTRCEVNINECSSVPCLNGGQCHDELNGYRCECSTVYTGSQCQYSICNVTDFCQNGGTCYDDLMGSVSCSCPVQFTGVHCDVETCDVLVCQNGGNCSDGVCNCLPDYIGALCDVYLCEHITCQNGGTCSAGSCICPSGWTGQYCHINIDECIENECQHDSTCEDHTDGYNCSCLPGFTGKFCEVIECSCINGGTCVEGVCLCPMNYTGETCEDHICDITSCDNGGTCEVVDGSAHCQCLKGFTGLYCEVDMCKNVTCQNNGTCDAGYCVCGLDYTGVSCESHICDVYGCQNGATCSTSNGVATCTCTDSFTGPKCQQDKCEQVDCKNGGTCVAGMCHCLEDFTGSLCDVDLCHLTECDNEGTCKAGVCQCVTGFTGQFCHMNINECESSPCQNEAVCEHKVNGYHCKCSEGYNGTHCENKINGPSVLNDCPLSKTGLSVLIGVICVLVLMVLFLAILLAMFRIRRNTKSSLLGEEVPADTIGLENPLYNGITNGTPSPRKAGSVSATVVTHC